MKISVIGTGNMGRTFGAAWSHAGHDVFFGARDLAKAEAAATHAAPTARVGTNADAARFGDVLLWTPRVDDPAAVVGSPDLLAGKVVLDIANGPMPQIPTELPVPSFAERLQAAAPGAFVVKAFNTMAQEVIHHDAETLRGYGVSAFLAGDDETAKATVATLARSLGLEPLDAGPLAYARYLEFLGDFIRHMMVSGCGLFATVSVRTLPPATVRYGGRQASSLA